MQNKVYSHISNNSVNWAKHYDYYEIELRDMYKTISKGNNESHFILLKNRARGYLKNDRIFCEIGFSAGITLRYALKYFKKVYGLDISPKNVEVTASELKAEGYTNFELFAFDLMKYDARFEGMFDVISFIHGLEHFSDSDYPIILTNIRKYLRPGGIFTGALPYNKDFIFRMCPKCDHIFEIDGHLSRHDIKSLSEVFVENGFKIVHISNFNLKYALSHGGILKKLYRLVFYYLLKQRALCQIEYIVKVA